MIWDSHNGGWGRCIGFLKQSLTQKKFRGNRENLDFRWRGKGRIQRVRILTGRHSAVILDFNTGIWMRFRINSLTRVELKEIIFALERILNNCYRKAFIIESVKETKWQRFRISIFYYDLNYKKFLCYSRGKNLKRLIRFLLKFYGSEFPFR